MENVIASSFYTGHRTAPFHSIIPHSPFAVLALIFALAAAAAAFLFAQVNELKLMNV